MTRVYSNDEFSKLKTVILGTFSKDSIPLEIQNASADTKKALEILDKAYPQWYLDEVNEDIENFRKILEGNDIKVLRPEWPFKTSQFNSPNWTTKG